MKSLFQTCFVITSFTDVYTSAIFSVPRLFPDQKHVMNFLLSYLICNSVISIFRSLTMPSSTSTIEQKPYSSGFSSQGTIKKLVLLSRCTYLSKLLLFSVGHASEPCSEFNKVGEKSGNSNSFQIR